MIGDTSTGRQARWRIAWIAGSFVLALVLAGLTGWAVLAIYFGDSATSLVQTALATVFGLVGLAAIAGVFHRRWRIRVLGIYALLFVAVLLWWFNIPASNDRLWQPDVARLAYATMDGDRITVHNVRNFAYRTETDFTPAYYSKSYDLGKLSSVDLFAVYWMGPAIAHTIISFGFDGQDYLAVSIEARKEQSEAYSAIKGFFRQYELIYVVADERDVIRLRTNYRQDPPEEVFRYRLQGSPEIARQFFLDYVKTINALRDQPRFYNTLTTNCTNVIWMHAHVNPGRIPFSWKILASGYAPEYLYDLGRLDTSVTFAELTRRGHVNPATRALGDVTDFSRQIRTEFVPSKR
ncbi:MAG: DUF4105 domain-containing protein [Pseudomonadota bacterium]|nr:MAG: DUF4105 domain-containing protein [Pseudomonadota bacterium]